jgi:hypothetical protein
MAFIKADMLLKSTNKSKSRKETLQRERSIRKQIIKHDMIMFNQC